MNINKQTKPNLIDPIIKQKLINTIKKPKVNYWEPTKNFFEDFYENYIKPNLISVIILIILVLILLYRYFMTQKNRLLPIPDTNNDINRAMLLYDYQKEKSLESKISYPIYI